MGLQCDQHTILMLKWHKDNYFFDDNRMTVSSQTLHIALRTDDVLMNKPKSEYGKVESVGFPILMPKDSALLNVPRLSSSMTPTEQTRT